MNSPTFTSYELRCSWCEAIGLTPYREFLYTTTRPNERVPIPLRLTNSFPNIMVVPLR